MVTQFANPFYNNPLLKTLLCKCLFQAFLNDKIHMCVLVKSVGELTNFYMLRYITQYTQ